MIVITIKKYVKVEVTARYNGEMSEAGSET
jgi:hypothetical protein